MVMMMIKKKSWVLASTTVDIDVGRTAVAVTLGGGSTCVILDDEKTFKCSGQNYDKNKLYKFSN